MPFSAPLPEGIGWKDACKAVMTKPLLDRSKAYQFAVPSMKFFVALVRDELKLKYAGNRILKYSDIESERVAICWLNVQMGWTLRASSYEQAARIPNHLNSQPEK